jgi:hypothetical protein
MLLASTEQKDTPFRSNISLHTRITHRADEGSEKSQQAPVSALCCHWLELSSRSFSHSSMCGT